VRSIPPGRAGRLFLLAKIGAARRSSELLDQKRQLLMREEARVATLFDSTRDEWDRACGEADEWLARMTLLGGQRELQVLASGREGRAELEVEWKSWMGFEQPAAGRSELPRADPLLDASGNAAGAPAVDAYRRALEAALAHGVAAEARRRVISELSSTRRRLRSITHRRIPALELLLHELELRLDAAELEEHVVSRWARQSQARDTGPARTA